MPDKPWAALVGLFCHYCLNGTVEVRKCTGCHRISYCNTECQNSDWKSHKVMCKALSKLEENTTAASELVSILPKEPITDVKQLDKLVSKQCDVYCRYLTGERDMELSLDMKCSWIEREPHCLACTRTDLVIRMESATAVGGLIPCSACKLSFCCSHAHWDIAKRLHHEPCSDLRDSPSQCHLNRLAHAQDMFAAAVLRDASGNMVWFPDRVKHTWVSLEGQSWNGEYHDELRKLFPHLDPSIMMAAVSDTLTLPMTILHGLSKLSKDDTWTKKQTLVVHIVGAGPREWRCSRLFEEILHRTPQVKTLKVIMCGPDAPDRKTHNVEICRDCKVRRGCSYVLEFVPEAYHDFVREQGSDFENPDLCIGFNSGANHSALLGYTWPTTFKLLVERKIPSLITAYGRNDAEKDAALLRAAGAALHPELGPILNPWGSMKAVTSPHSTYRFNVNSGWLAGGFK
ncbi:hypothetical protein C8R47DRAFT_1102677 [Mycena vitilis]|nr:hypothetical protein C8R47DRAFT_1102677 [Mycena vitilis]